MATLTERSAGVWLARVFLPPTSRSEQGRQVGKTFRGNKKSVRAAVAAWEADLRGTSPNAVGATVADLLELWQQSKAHDWQPTTVRDHRSRADAVSRDLGRVRLVDLDPMRIDAWIADMRRQGVGDGALRSRVASLRAAATWGVSRRMLRSNPVAEAAPRLRVTRREPRSEPAEVAAIIEQAGIEGPRASLALRIAALTGAREAEVVALQWDDLKGTQLHIGRQRHSLGPSPLVRPRTKNGRSREVVLDAGTVRNIASWGREVERTVGSRGTWMLAEPGSSLPPSPRWLYDVFVRAARRAGVTTGRRDGIVLHDLRHWAASSALRDGHDPVTVAARLGHSPETLMRVYAQEIERGQVDVASSLAARLDR